MEQLFFTSLLHFLKVISEFNTPFKVSWSTTNKIYFFKLEYNFFKLAFSNGKKLLHRISYASLVAFMSCTSFHERYSGALQQIEDFFKIVFYILYNNFPQAISLE